MQKYIMILAIYVFFCMPITKGFCEWQGHVEVISGHWGKGAGEFGFIPARPEGEDAFPDSFGVNDKGYIYISDCVNDVIHKYDQNGLLIKDVIAPPAYEKYWNVQPAYDSFSNVYIHPKGGFLVRGSDLHYLFFGADDNLIVSIYNPKGYAPIVIGEKGYYFESGSNFETVKYYLYSIDGKLIGIYEKSQIDELGSISEKSSSANQYRYQIKYSDGHVYHAIHKTYASDYFRDKFKTLFYILPTGKVYRQTACSDEVTVFSIPDSKIDQNRPPRPPRGKDLTAYFNWTPTFMEGYGRLVVSNNGDIYCYKRTPETYSIIKWIWIESRDAPVNLKASVSKGKISLSWETPKQDANSIKAYEIYRSSDVCGPFNKIDKVKKGVLQYTDKEVKEGETYYYQVCAERGSGYSGYSNKAVGSIKN